MKKFNFIDLIIIIGVLIALSVGFSTMKHFRQTADKQIEATSPIVFQVFLRGVTLTASDFPIKINDKTFISIRNVPYTELDVIEVNSQTRKTYAPNAKLLLVNDPAQPSVYDAVPSGHSATVGGLAMMCALREGFGSPIFAIAFVLATIVCHDAMNVRYESGKQAEILNDLVEWFNDTMKVGFTEKKLKEFLGHTPLQVLVGVLLGVANALLLHFFVF